METEILNPAVHVAIGDRLQSNSTIFINGSDVLLVEAMAAREDAEKLREYVETELNKRVRFILCTNYFSDHMAALKLFPHAQIITHKDYSHTFAIEAFRSAEESDFFVEPHILLSDELVIKWGDVTLNIFHNPSQTMTNLNIDVPECDLIIASDAVVGNIVYLRYSSMDVLNRALKRLQRAGRKYLLTGHMGIRSIDVIDNALFYLGRLREIVITARESSDATESVLKTELQTCLPSGVVATEFEENFHRRNLETIVGRRFELH
jgi:glyoxylase-like metal-dependent hydrolase (beta-lactamase superfamily II)